MRNMKKNDNQFGFSDVNNQLLEIGVWNFMKSPSGFTML